MRALLLALALICSSIAPSLAVRYEMHDLGAVYPCAINNLGQYAGVVVMADGTERAFVRQGQETNDLGIGFAQGINDVGQVTFYSGPNNNPVASIWQGGVASPISGLSPGYSDPLRINNQGQIIGTTRASSIAQGWIWQDGSLTYLGTMGSDVGSVASAVNNVGQVIGKTIKSNNYTGTPFIWQDGEMSPIPGIPKADSLSAINDSGVISGSDWNYYEGYAWTEACIWQDGVRTFLGTLARPTDRWHTSYATDINNQGSVVGSSYDSDGFTSRHRAFVWQDGVMLDLGTTLEGETSYADAINDLGWIIGHSFTADGQMHGVLWTPVPEPSSVCCLLAGCLMMCRFCFRRKCHS